MPSRQGVNRDIDACRLFWRSVWNEFVDNQLLSCFFTTTLDFVRFNGCGLDLYRGKAGKEFGGGLVQQTVNRGIEINDMPSSIEIKKTV